MKERDGGEETSCCCCHSSIPWNHLGRRETLKPDATVIATNVCQLLIPRSPSSSAGPQESLRLPDRSPAPQHLSVPPVRDIVPVLPYRVATVLPERSDPNRETCSVGIPYPCSVFPE